MFIMFTLSVFYLCAEEPQFECVGLDSGQRQHAVLQPVRIHRSWQQVAMTVQGANGMWGLRIIPYTCRWLDRLKTMRKSQSFRRNVLSSNNSVEKRIKDFNKGWGKSTRKCGVLPADTQSASQGQMGNVGHMTWQLCGFSCHLGVQDGFKGQHEAWCWGEKARKHKTQFDDVAQTFRGLEWHKY